MRTAGTTESAYDTASTMRSPWTKVLSVALLCASPAPAAAELVLPDPTSPVYYRYLAVAGERIDVDQGARLMGELHSNDDARFKAGSTVNGDVSAVGEIDDRGDGSGARVAGAEPLVLPVLPEAATLQALADRVLEGDVTLTDEVLDDVVFVDGTAVITGRLDGAGTLIATGDVRFETSNAIIEPSTRLSVIAYGDVRIAKERSFRGLIQAGGDLSLEKDVLFEGVLVAGRRLDVKKDAELSFADLDDTPPELVLVSPSTDPVINDPTPEIVLEANDAISGVDPASWLVTYDGVSIGGECTFTVTGAICDPPALGSRMHALEARVRDRAGNLATATFEFELVLDEVPPILKIVEPSALLLVERVAPPIVLDLRDVDSGLDVASLRLELDGADASASCTLQEDSRAVCLPPLAAGSHTVSAEIRDRAGNLSVAEQVFELVLDVEPPVLTLISPPPGALVLSEGSPTVTVEYADAVAGVDFESLVLAVDGAQLSDCVLTQTQAVCSTDLPPGTYTLTATLADRLGNPASESRTFAFTLDETPPELAILSPSEPFLLATGSVQVEAVFSDGESGIDPASLELRLDATDLLADCTVTANAASCAGVPVGEGAHSVLATVRDRAGRRTSARVDFQVEAVDVTPPALRFVSPEGPVVRPADAVPVVVEYDDVGSGVDATSFTLRVDGVDRSAECELDAFSASCPALSEPGSHRLEAGVRDHLGNLGEAELDVAVSLHLALTIDEPGNGTLTTAGEIDLAGAIDPRAESVSVGDLAGVVEGETFTLTAVPLHEGANTLTVVARGGEGEVGTATVTVLRDTTPPRVIIQSPPAGFEVRETPLMVTGTVIDAASSAAAIDPPRVLVNGSPARVQGGSFLAEIPLLPGSQVLRVQATDAAGNVATATRTVEAFARAALPRMRSMRGQGQRAGAGETLPEPLVVRLTDAGGVPLAGRQVVFTVTRGHGTVSSYPREGETLLVRTDTNGLAEVSFTLGSRAGEGNHEVTATSPGFPGGVIFCASASPGPPITIRRLAGDDPVAAHAGLAGAAASKPFQIQVFDALGNPVPGVEVRFEVLAGGGSIAGEPAAEVVSDAEGRASVVPILGPEPGLNNQVVEARFDGLEGLPATYLASAVLAGPESETAVRGLVLDARDVPIAGVTVRLAGTELEVLTGPDGRFLLAGAPVGTVELTLDPSTATRPGPWPQLAFRFTTLSGHLNELGTPIRLPRLDAAGERLVGGAQDVTLRLADLPGAELTVFAQSTTFPDGSPTGLLTFSQVPGDRVPMEAPMGSGFPLAWAIQPAGVVFDPPARISIPNVSGSPPGTVVDVFSFDHDLGEFLSVGTASVSDDARVLVSDPGFGVIKSGWHGGVPPPRPSTTVCNGSIRDVSLTANLERDEVVVTAGEAVDLRASIGGGCTRKELTWSFGDGTSLVGSSRLISHVYEPGIYTASLTVECKSCPGEPVGDIVRVRVVEVDLVLQGLGEEDETGPPHEERPGAFLVVNDDDDDDNETPDFDDVEPASEENDLAPLAIGFDRELDQGTLRLEASGGAGRIRVWSEPSKGEEVVLPVLWDLAAGEDPPEMLYLEGVGSSAELRDVELTLSYLDGESAIPLEDRVLVTVIDLDFKILPASPYAVLAPEQTAEIVAAVFQHDFEDPELLIPVEDGAEVEWRITEGEGGTLSVSTSGTEEGYALTRLTTTTAPDDRFRVEGRLKSFRFRDAPVELSAVTTQLEPESDEIVVLPGVPTAIELVASTSSYSADATATVSFTATVRDATGNLVADGTRVAWIVDRSTEDFLRMDGVTVDGVATAELLSPSLPVDQEVSVRSGSASTTQLLTVDRVAGQLTSSDAELDMKLGETATLTASVNAADGTPVFWLTSNGTITASSVVENGQANALLTTEGGCLGPVVATATIGERMLHWEGEMVSSHHVWMSVENRYLVAHATQDGFTTHVRPDETVTQAPFFASTGITIHGGAGELAIVQVPEQEPFEAYSFDTLTGDQVPGLIGGSPLGLGGAQLDPLAAAGAASLLFDPEDSATVDAELDFAAGLGVSFSLLPSQLAPGNLAAQDGSWSIEFLADGRVLVTVLTDTGVFTVESSEPLALDSWNDITVETTGDSLLLVINGDVVENEDFSGDLLPSTASVELGGGYSGRVDELTLYDVFAPLPYQLEGLAAGRRTVLGLDGTASFTVRSRGTLEIEDFTAKPFTLGVAVAALPSGLRSVARGQGKNAGGENNATASVFFVNETTWEIFGDMVSSFFGGDPETTAGTLANVAGGMLVVGDIGAIVKNAWRMFGFSEKEPNNAELVLSGLGLVTEFWVGIGEIVDVPISAARAVVARIGNTPFAEVLVNRLKKIFTRGEVPSQDEIDVLKLLQADEAGELLDPINRLVRSEEIWQTVAKVCRSATGLLSLAIEREQPRKTEAVHRFLIEQIDKAITAQGDLAVGQDIVRVLGILNDPSELNNALFKLLQAGPSQLEVSIAGLGKALKMSEAPHEWIGWIAIDSRVINSFYDQARFFEDLGKMAEVDGLKKLLKSMDSVNPGAIGFRYELEVAVFKHDELSGSVRMMELGAPLKVPEFAELSDIDVLVNGVAIQAKRNIRALIDYGVEKAEYWIKAAQARGDVDRVVFALPDISRVPEEFRLLFDRLNVELSQIPHL